MIAGPGLVVAGVCWCRKVVAGSGLVVAGAELVAAGICWRRKVVAGAGRRFAGVGLVVTGAELVAAGICWCRKVAAYIYIFGICYNICGKLLTIKRFCQNKASAKRKNKMTFFSVPRAKPTYFFTVRYKYWLKIIIVSWFKKFSCQIEGFY